ncbi:glycoside hydrolase [Rhypophila decipiens]|uniref:Glycoside hydrolase n=1 Tax=Rhypophila decipiens TaxID=261697 RepID=A0AAN7B160_9PEZI|nr:glycoside hydrolase [Rhypophila decipiens]
MHLSNLVTRAGATSSTVFSRQMMPTASLSVNLSQTYQTIDGFGFSEAFQRAYNIYNLAEPKRSQLIDLFFNVTTGAGFSIVRNGIGSSPNSTSDWMNTHLPTSPGSPASSNASYVWDGKDSGQLWVSQQAVKYGVKTFYGNAWSAPGFMKTNGRDSGGGSLCGVPNTTCSTGDWRQAYADYLVKYIEFYQQSGVDVTHVGFLNEPDYLASYASMLSTGSQSADFIKILHSTLQNSPFAGKVQIACCDATGWSAQRAMTTALVDAGVEDLLGVITSHPYTSPINSTQPTALKVWQTETSDLVGKWSTAWYTSPGDTPGDGYTWAINIHTALTTGNVSAYLWWVGTQDEKTNGNNNEKLVLVDSSKGEYFVSKRFWAFAQYSRTVRPGAVRVGVVADGDEELLKTTGFVNVDGSVVVNVINTGVEDVGLSVAVLQKDLKVLVAPGGLEAWVTDDGNDMSALEGLNVQADGTVGGVSVPARGMVSFVIRLHS